MRLQVTLMLICLLFPEVQGLRCYECTPGLSGTCTQTELNCPDQCISSNTVVYVGGAQQEVQVKGCGAQSQCISGMMNFGAMKITSNTKCCSTPLCNDKPVPALSRGSPNGRKCYACVSNECTGSVNCEGDEDQCISIKGSAGGIEVKMKGCASRSVCTAGPASMNAGGVSGTASCCQGDLCNGAESVNLSRLLLILGPLLSSITFFDLPFSFFLG